MDEILTPKEVAKYLRVAERTVHRLAHDSKVPCFKVGGSWRFRRFDIDQWIASQTSRELSDIQSELDFD